MYISRFKLANFKSYREPSSIEFTPGLNIVVGQNNAGKSALLGALRLEPAWKLHRQLSNAARGRGDVSSRIVDRDFLYGFSR